MSRATIQSEIATVLDAVVGIENVYQVHRQALDPNTFITRYRESDATDIQVWFVTRTATGNHSSEHLGRGQIPIRAELWRYHTFTIEGFYGFRDNVSETAFQDLLDALLTAFNNQRSLGGFQATPLQVDNVGMEPFGGLHCHHTILTTTVIEIVKGLAPV